MKNIFYAITTIILFSCGGNDSNVDMNEIESNITESFDDAPTISKKQIKELKSASKVVYTLPPPLEMANLLHETGAAYNVDILNNPNNVNNYVTDFKRSLNFGVYFADLSFTSMFDHPQEAMKYMGASQAMSEELNIQGVFTDDVMMRLEENLSNRDSLMDIVASTYLETDLYLQDNERPMIAKSILSGAWLEGLYIAVNLSTEKGEEEKIWKKIGEQKPALSNLIKMLEESSDTSFSNMISDLKNLEKTFEEVQLNYGNSNSEKTDTINKTTTLVDTLEIVISEATFNSIKEQATNIRNTIVK